MATISAKMEIGEKTGNKLSRKHKTVTIKIIDGFIGIKNNLLPKILKQKVFINLLMFYLLCFLQIGKILRNSQARIHF